MPSELRKLEITSTSYDLPVYGCVFNTRMPPPRVAVLINEDGRLRIVVAGHPPAYADDVTLTVTDA